MKTYSYILLCSLGLCCLAFYLEPYIYKENNPEQVKELASIAHPIRTINPADTNYQDLLFLKDKLKNVDMVMLGEQQHGDGATFLAKSRLIKFLHQELDFDVLLFESGIYDCYLLWNTMQGEQKSKTTDFDQALFYFWGTSNETKNLREYIVQNAKSTEPLVFGGFDIQFSGTISESKRTQLIESYLAKKDISLKKDYKNFSKTLENYRYNTYSYPSDQIPKKEKQTIFKEIEDLSQRLAKVANTNEDRIFIRYLLSIQANLKSKWLYTYNERQQRIIRDSMMAENVIWLKNNLYKNKKIILWAANYHIAYHSKTLNNPTERDNKMGDYLKTKYDSLCYGINFTSYSGQTRNIVSGDTFQINDSSPTGIESILHTTSKPFAFIDSRSLAKKSFLNGTTTMKFFGHSNSSEKWSKITDGMFFIDKMKPITFN